MTAQPDPFAYSSHRDAIVQALLAQAMGGQTGDPGSAQFPEYQYPVDPADPADYSAAPSVSNVGFATNTSGHLADALSNPEGTLGSVLGNPAAGMPSPSMNAPSVSDLSQAAVPGDFGPAPSPGRSPGDFSAAFNAFDAAAKGDRGDISQAGRLSDAAPASVLGPSISQSAINEGHNANVAAALADVLGGYPSSTPDPGVLGPSVSQAAVNEGHNANVASALSDVIGGYSVTGTPGPAASSTGNVASDVGVGIGLGISGGFGGATGDGTSGGFSGAVGDGVGGASTGISGGPGGTGEGGANTGEGGTGDGGGGGGGGGGSGK